MVTDFSQLHHQVHQVFDFCLRFKHLEELFDVELLLNGLVKNLLTLGHLAKHLMLILFTNFMFDVLLDTP